MSSDAMTGVGILQDDLMVVDKSIPPQHLHIVLAVVDGEFFVRRLFKKGRVVRLTPENEKYQTIELVDGQELRIWGVVTACLRHLM